MSSTKQSYRMESGVAATEGDASSPSFLRRLMDVLVGEKVANAAVALAIAVGFFHGWLKLQIRHPIATFLFDIPLMFALALVWMRAKGLENFFPPGHAARALKVFYAVVGIWFVLSAVLPWGAPFLAALAAVRGWVFSTLMLGLGYQIIGSRRQLHGYFILIILLSAVTALYATRQTQEEVEALRAMDPYFEMMTRGQSFVDDEGRLVLRRFSTFVSSGAFGGTMAVSLLLLASLVTDRLVGRWEKLILYGLALAIGWGMFLSGARSAVVCFAVGLVVVVWFRRMPVQLWILAGLCAVGLYLGAQWTDGGVLDRLASLDLKAFWYRFYIVWSPGTRYLLESNFVGGGLGKAGVGFPMSLVAYIGRFRMWGVDGDLGKTMAEMGIVGVVVVCWLLWNGLRDGYGIVVRNRGNSVGTMGLGALCALSTAVLTYPTGSPFVGIPLGVLTWFFLGAALKLEEVEGMIPVAAPLPAKGSSAERRLAARAALRAGEAWSGQTGESEGRGRGPEAKPGGAAVKPAEKAFLYATRVPSQKAVEATPGAEQTPTAADRDPKKSAARERRKPFLYS